jgi:hypothetical protein
MNPGLPRTANSERSLTHAALVTVLSGTGNLDLNKTWGGKFNETFSFVLCNGLFGTSSGSGLRQEEPAESQKPKAQTAAPADRLARMSAVVKKSNVYRWVGDLIATLARPRPSDGAE